MKILSLVRALPQMLLPRVCPVCGRGLIEAERAVCMHCLVQLPRTRMHLDPDNSIVARVAHPGLRLQLAAAWMDYRRDSPFAAIVRDAKYSHMPRLAREAGRLFALELLADRPDALADIDVLLPVPLHWRRLLRRGYNQSEEIARGISAATGIPVGDNLRASRSHRSQTRSTADERRRNVAGIARVRYAEELAGLHVAVVDDVVTTGATMADALHALTTQASPRALSVLALAAVPASPWAFAGEAAEPH